MRATTHMAGACPSSPWSFWQKTSRKSRRKRQRKRARSHNSFFTRPSLFMFSLCGRTRPILAASALGRNDLSKSTQRSFFHQQKAPIRWQTWLLTSIYLMTALPWPAGIETKVVHGLTNLISQLTTEIILLSGFPAEMVGNSIRVDQQEITINQACSGISFPAKPYFLCCFPTDLFSL